MSRRSRQAKAEAIQRLARVSAKQPSSKPEAWQAISRWLSVPGTVFAEGELWCGAKRYHRNIDQTTLHPGGMAASPGHAGIPSGMHLAFDMKPVVSLRSTTGYWLSSLRLSSPDLTS